MVQIKFYVYGRNGYDDVHYILWPTVNVPINRQPDRSATSSVCPPLESATKPGSPSGRGRGLEPLGRRQQ